MTMHLNRGLKIIALALSAQTILGSPAGLQQRSKPMMTIADAFHNSGLDYQTWAQLKVDQGKMFYPENRTVQLHTGDTTRAIPGGIGLRNIVCEHIGATEYDYKRGTERFCQFLNNVANNEVFLISLFLETVICNGNPSFACDMGIIAWSEIGKQFVETQIPAFCPSLFHELWTQCGNRGGIGEIWTDGDKNTPGVPFGTWNSQFYFHDGGNQCFENEREICRIEPFF